MNLRRAAFLLLALLPVVASLPAQSVTVTRAPTDEEFVGPLSSWRNLKTTYGAVGDGVADDTTALENALQALRVAHQNGWSTLYIPAGTYRLTRPITVRRVDTNADFQGTMIVGADPVTTILRYDGVTGGHMLTFDGWYNKMSRLTFDGAGKADIGLNRDGAFSTTCEISDVYFKDLTRGIVFTNGTEYGQAETLVIRCQFDRVGTAIATGNFNSLDIWCWYNIFRDCGTGIYNYAGNFHAVGNLFLRSTSADLDANNAFNFVVIDNTSIGSALFSNVLFGNVLLQRNRVYAPANSNVINGANWTLLLDNVINSSAFPGVGPVSLSGVNLAVGNTFTTTYGVRPYDPYGNLPGASPARAFDNNTSTFSERGSFNYAEVTLDYAYANRATNTVTRYALTSVDGALNNVPTAFTLLGSNNQGRTWTTLDTRSGISWTSAAQRKVFTVASPGAYEAYRLRVDSTGGGTLKIAEIELLNSSDADTTDDGLGLASSPYFAVRTRSLDETTVAASTLPTPTSVAMPLAPVNYNRTVFTVARNTGDDAQAIQNAINAAAAAGNRAVVHLPAGIYSIARTIVVPANKDIQIIGDGSSRTATRLESSGSADFLVLKLEGPSRATLRDFYIQGGSPLLVTNANQTGGRVYAEQLLVAGQSRPAAAAKSYFFNGVEDTDITFIACQSGNTYGSVVDSGGPKLSSGQPAASQHSFITGTYEGLQTHGEVVRGARLTLLALYSEGARRHMYDLTGDGLLNSIANVDHSVADERIPTFTLDGFKGRFNYFLNLQDKFSVAAPTSWFDLRGDGSAMNVLIGLNDFGVTTGGDVVRDSTSPAADFSLHLNNVGGSYTRRQAGLEPTDAFIRDQLASLREMRIELPTARAAGVTDLKLFRVSLTPTRGGTGLEIRAAADPSDVAPTVAPVLTATPTAPNVIEFTWTPVPGATHYSLERIGPGESGFSEIKVFNAALRTSYRDVNLEHRSNYTYRLRAWNSAGFSPYSASLTRTTPASLPRATASTRAASPSAISSATPAPAASRMVTAPSPSRHPLTAPASPTPHPNSFTKAASGAVPTISPTPLPASFPAPASSCASTSPRPSSAPSARASATSSSTKPSRCKTSTSSPPPAVPSAPWSARSRPPPTSRATSPCASATSTTRPSSPASRSSASPAPTRPPPCRRAPRRTSSASTGPTTPTTRPPSRSSARPASPAPTPSSPPSPPTP
jgi:hypothetical protein